jgi:hypothetical protein
MSKILIVVSAVLFLAACGGGDSDNTITTTTTGQQLVDLQKAYEAGALTKEQYDEQKEIILDKADD